MDNEKRNRQEENSRTECPQLHTSKLLAAEESTALQNFYSGVKHGAIDQPIAALAQIRNSFCNDKTYTVLPTVEIANETSSHKLGEIIGSFVPFAIAGVLTKGVSNRLLGEASSPSLCRVMGEHASTGFIMGSVLSTSNLKAGENLFSARLSQGLCCAATFASMSGSAGLLESSLPKAKSFGLMAGRSIGIAALSGATGGAVDVELKTGFKAKKEDVLNSSLGFAGFGIMMEASGLALSPRSMESLRLPSCKSKQSAPESSISQASVKVASESDEINLVKSANQNQEQYESKEQASLKTQETQNKYEHDFIVPRLHNNDLPFAREQVLRDFKNIGFRDANGTHTDLYSELMNCEHLADVQKIRLIDTACQIRNHYARIKQEEGMSSEAPRNWLYHQAALAEIFNDLSEMTAIGEKPEPKALEYDCLLALFSQFRSHRDRSNLSSIYQDRSTALQQVLIDTYPPKHIEKLADDLYDLPVAAHPTDLISFDKTAFEFLSPAKAPERAFRTKLDSAKVDHNAELNKLSERFSNLFERSDPRLSRIDRLLADFESSNRVSTEKRALFYQQLNRLLQENDRAKLTLPQRIDLSEQVLNHTHDLSSIDQGVNRTCNVTTVENRIYARQPHEMARLIADIAEHGCYTTSSGRQINLSRSLTGLKPDAEARACLRQQADGMNAVKRDGARDWASQLAQTTMVKIFHEGEAKLITGDLIMEDSRLAYDRHGSLLGIVETNQFEKFVDAKGQPIDEMKADTKLFKKDGMYIQEIDPEQVIYDERGNPCASLSEKHNLTRLYDYTGRSIDKLSPGTICFDADGNFALYNSVPGEVTYDKVLSVPKVEFKPETRDELERMHVLHLGKRTFLKEMKTDKTIEKISGPCLGARTYRSICNEITGAEKQPFSIMKDSPPGTFFSTIRIDNIDDFEKAVLEIQAQDNLPAILVVNTRNTPEKDNPFSSKNPNAEGGAHVVNIHSYDPVTKLLRITNQWGSIYDYMDTGVELDKVYKAMHF